MSTRQPGRRRANAAMICWVASLAALEMNPTPQHPGRAAGGGLGLSQRLIPAGQHSGRLFR